MMQSTTIIAFDQHAATVVAAVLLPGERTPALHPLTSDLPTIRRFLARLAAPGVRCCYEAGPCGFELQRALTRAGDRLRRDRAGADSPARRAIASRRIGAMPAQLAVLYRAGALTAIHIPTEQEEAARDLLRCREDIRADLLRARHRLSKFLLRHGRRFPDGRAWSKRYDAWLRAQTWPLAALEQTLHAYRRAVDESVARLRAVEDGSAGRAHVAAAAPPRRAAALLPRHR